MPPSQILSGFNIITNSTTLASQERKASLNQDGHTRQPDIIGKCVPPFVLYYGELKPKIPRIEDSNTDRLRIAIFTKDSLDQLDRKLASPPLVVSFQAIDGVGMFYIGAKVGNVIVHSKLSTITLPSQLSQLNVHDEVFPYPHSRALIDNGAQAMAEALKSNSTLTTLVLYGTSVGENGVQVLAEALKTNSDHSKFSVQVDRRVIRGQLSFGTA
ncbi:hypothetical protein F5H01DRAFT_371294 [Linnemannia elongata]|nr:hypothetical protein F5H01DRAFT_371294 [Linnemannia elongata]